MEINNLFRLFILYLKAKKGHFGRLSLDLLDKLSDDDLRVFEENGCNIFERYERWLRDPHLIQDDLTEYKRRGFLKKLGINNH